MVRKTRIAVISDLHIGTETITLDLCPYELPAEKKVGIRSDFLSVFHNYVSSSSFKRSGPVDMLCVTGDISNRADPKEFQHAHLIITKIGESLGVPKEKIYYVPGNHDVHWPVMALEPKEFWDKYRYEPLLQENLLFRDRLSSATRGAFDTSPFFVAWHSEDRLVVGINTAAFDSPEPEQKKHHGLVHSHTLADLKKFLSTLPLLSSELRICLLHHHPINYSDVNPDLADFSIAVNAGNLFELLSEHRFDLMIHGHKHVPQLQHRAASTNGHPITILGAGSLSAKLGSQWYGIAQNQFHIIEVAGRDLITSVTYGNVATWNYIGGGWREANHQMGFCAIEGFGSLSTPAQLQSQIEQELRSASARSDFTLCRWRDLVAKIPTLSHASTKVAYEALCAAGASLKLEVLASLDNKKDQWVVLPKCDEEYDEKK